MAKRVLFLPHNLRRAYFLSLLRQFKAAADWDIGVVAPADSRRDYDGIVDSDESYFRSPDFARREGWESKSGERERISNLIGECERLTGISSSRVLLAGERDIGRAYSEEFYHWPLNKLAKFAKNNNEFPANALERMFWFADDALKRFRPDLILSGATAMPLHFVFSLVAERNGIPLVANRQSKVHSRRIYWTMDRAMFNTRTRGRYAEIAESQSPVSQTSREYIDRFREEPKTVHYIAENWRKASQTKWGAVHWSFILLALRRLDYIVRKRKKGLPPKEVLPRIAGFYRERYLTFWQERMFRKHEPEQLTAFKYIYCPLHKEPELAVNFQAPHCHNQKELIAYLSKTLPHGIKLLVREHRFNLGRRPTAYYKTLLGYPGVELIHPFDPQFKYIRNADLIVTDNGSTGWEGVVFGRPVITLAQTFYDPPGLMACVRAPEELNSEILRLLNAPNDIDPEEYDRRIGWFLDAEQETTLPEDEDHFEESLQIIEKLVSEGLCTNIHSESSVKVKG
ncbi:MAG: hypothetical protein QF919_11020 [Nitrospinota bacterium]|nr:hypothetical protein [Nitrospinota bacterium]